MPRSLAIAGVVRRDRTTSATRRRPRAAAPRRAGTDRRAPTPAGEASEVKPETAAAPEQPKTVIVTVAGVPEGTEVSIAGMPIGAAPGPVQLPRGDVAPSC